MDARANELESRASWSEPEGDIDLSTLKRIAGGGFEVLFRDCINRLWYRIQQPKPCGRPTEDDCNRNLLGCLARLRSFHDDEGQPPPWNTFTISLEGNILDYIVLPPPLLQSFTYANGSYETLPFSALSRLRHMDFLVDSCFWEEEFCVFKRIESQSDIQRIKREIAVREHLMKNNIDTTHVVPILRVIISEGLQWQKGSVAGILMHHHGMNLQSMCEHGKDVRLNLQQLIDLTSQVRRILRTGQSHGDIKPWNILLSSRERSENSPRLMLIDLELDGSVSSGYPGDARALANFFNWCAEKRLIPEEGLFKVRAATGALQRSDFETAIRCLR